MSSKMRNPACFRLTQRAWIAGSLNLSADSVNIRRPGSRLLANSSVNILSLSPTMQAPVPMAP
ncbi:MAG: hypothetical protein ACD_10C00654G0001 [uncultured bacterium]|nr:MAG: hypothetical protein ACD_10C00654G0001 [uncultured bacterium]